MLYTYEHVCIYHVVVCILVIILTLFLGIHGDKTQQDRDQTLQDFRTGKFPILVATGTAHLNLLTCQSVCLFILCLNTIFGFCVQRFPLYELCMTTVPRVCILYAYINTNVCVYRCGCPRFGRKGSATGGQLRHA